MAWRIRGSCLFLFVILIAGCGPTPAPPTPRPTEPTVTQKPTVATATPTPPPTTAAPPGRLRMFSFPPRATIRLDGEPLDGTTPWAVDVQPGTHSLEMTLPFFQPWKEEVQITSGAILRVEARLQHVLPFTVLVPDNPRVASVQWDSDGRGLVYAVDNNVHDEPKDWSWYRHDLTTGLTQELPPPPSRVSDEVRAELGLCPLDREAETTTCIVATVLYESPTGDHMVYAPPEVVLGPDGETPWGGDFHLWHADTDGGNRVLLGPRGFSLNAGEGGRPGVTWSPREDWVLIDVSYEPIDVYLAKTDGSVFHHFPPLPPPGEVLHSYLFLGFLPVFSPDGDEIAYAGLVWDEQGQESTGIWITDVEPIDLRKVSDRVGLLQWSNDGRHLYVLELGTYLGALYRIDLEQDPPEEDILAEGLPVYGYPWSPRRLIWALSPDETAVAYYGVDLKGHFGIVRLPARE